MVNAPNKNHSLQQVGIHGILTQCCTQQRRQLNECNSSLEADRVWGVGALRSLHCKNNLIAEKQQEIPILNLRGNTERINDFIDRETAAERTPVKDSEIAILQE